MLLSMECGVESSLWVYKQTYTKILRCTLLEFYCGEWYWSPFVLWPSSERCNNCLSSFKTGIVYCRRCGAIVKPDSFPVEMDRSTALLIAIYISILILSRIIHNWSICIQSDRHLKGPKILWNKRLNSCPSFYHKPQCWKLARSVWNHASLLKSIKFLLQS